MVGNHYPEEFSLSAPSYPGKIIGGGRNKTADNFIKLDI